MGTLESFVEDLNERSGLPVGLIDQGSATLSWQDWNAAILLSMTPRICCSVTDAKQDQVR